MLLQISSGQGPEECEYAVGKFLAYMQENYAVSIVKAVKGKYKNSFKSIILSCNEDLSFLEGSIKWSCKSPFRPKNKRKNWFIDVSVVQEAETIEVQENLLRFDTFRCGGKGGQNVNKVETGVRVTFIPTGLSVTSTSARSQHMNKKLAINRLCEIIATENQLAQDLQDKYHWLEHTRIERGNPILIFEGLDFALTDKK